MDKDKIIIYLLVGLAIVTIFNQFQIFGLAKSSNSANELSPVTGLTTGIGEVSALDVVPKGVPEIYGKELGISYDDVSVSNPQKADLTIRKLALFDVSMNMTGDKLDRYIAITNSISCEYCCGAQSITFSNGDPACGCAHSYAMRGLAKYLLTEHPEMQDEAILEELGKWKTLFFPDTLNAKAFVLKEQGIELSYVNLASNKYRGAEQVKQVSQSGQGSMVGGC